MYAAGMHNRHIQQPYIHIYSLQLIEGEERRAAKRTASESKVSYPLPLPLTSNPQP